jgi:hypothetical protein
MIILLKNQILIYRVAASTFIAGVLHLAIVPMFLAHVSDVLETSVKYHL